MCFGFRCITNGRRVIDRWQNTCPCSSCGWDSLLHLAPCWGVSSVSISQDTSSFQHDFCSSAPCPAVPWPCSPSTVSLDIMGNVIVYIHPPSSLTSSDTSCPSACTACVWAACCTQARCTAIIASSQRTLDMCGAWLRVASPCRAWRVSWSQVSVKTVCLSPCFIHIFWENSEVKLCSSLCHSPWFPELSSCSSEIHI